MQRQSKCLRPTSTTPSWRRHGALPVPAPCDIVVPPLRVYTFVQVTGRVIARRVGGSGIGEESTQSMKSPGSEPPDKKQKSPGSEPPAKQQQSPGSEPPAKKQEVLGGPGSSNGTVRVAEDDSDSETLEMAGDGDEGEEGDDDDDDDDLPSWRPWRNI